MKLHSLTAPTAPIGGLYQTSTQGQQNGHQQVMATEDDEISRAARLAAEEARKALGIDDQEDQQNSGM